MRAKMPRLLLLPLLAVPLLPLNTGCDFLRETADVLNAVSNDLDDLADDLRDNDDDDNWVDDVEDDVHDWFD